MRRHDKEIKGLAEIEEVIKQSQVCHLAMSTGDAPYLVPLSFGYHEQKLYFHSARTGQKIAMLQDNPQVCFSFTIDEGVKQGPVACEWGVRYRSVIGTGRVRFVEDESEKVSALDVVMQHYAPGKYTYSASSLANTAVFIVDIESLSGKSS